MAVKHVGTRPHQKQTKDHQVLKYEYIIELHFNIFQYILPWFGEPLSYIILVG